MMDDFIYDLGVGEVKSLLKSNVIDLDYRKEINRYLDLINLYECIVYALIGLEFYRSIKKELEFLK